MTTMNVNTKFDKPTLMGMIGKAIFINGFNEPIEYFPNKSGYYFIDSVIFHHDNHVEIGVSEYEPNMSLKDFDIDKSHIGFYNLEDLDIPLEDHPPISIL